MIRAHYDKPPHCDKCGADLKSATIVEGLKVELLWKCPNCGTVYKGY